VRRVIVIGAGLSGLTCGYRLLGHGLDVAVLEARDRVGGRVWRRPVGHGLEFDFGAEAVDEAHAALLGLAAELGVRTRLAAPWEGDGLPASLQALDERIAEIARCVDPLHPEDLDSAAALDAQSLEDWLVADGASPGVLAEAETWYAVASSSVPIGQMSLLAMAAKAAAGASPRGLRVRIDGGPSALASRLHERLAERVVLGTQAVAVEQEQEGIVVRTADGRVARARRAVLAIPLTLQRALRFEPPLPDHCRVALERARYGRVVKAAAAFAEQYRAEGDPPLSELTGEGLVYEPDDSRRLIGLFAGSGAAGRARPPGPAVDWSREPFSRGSYLIFGPGDLLAWGRGLAEPYGRLHFAGAEASTLPSYLEGAVRAGERAAAEVAAAL
jgi:monoamine oxidase